MPEQNSIPAFQIDAARKMHLLTTQSRLPARNNAVPNPFIHTSILNIPKTKPDESNSSGPAIRTPVSEISSRASKSTTPCKRHSSPCECCGQIIIPAPVSSFPIQDTPSIQVKDWLIFTERKPILNSKEIENFETILNFPVPEMIFGNNKVELLFKGKFHFIFNSLEALKSVNYEANNELKVSYAKDWYSSRFGSAKGDEPNDGVDMSKVEIVKPFDWTYTTYYDGTLLNGPEWIPDNTVDIPVEKLSNSNPILFFDDMILYEDELADNGCSILNIKIRVMKDCLLLLQRFYLRVDNVIFKVIDTRIYIDFDSLRIIKQQKVMELEYNFMMKIAKKESSDPTKLLRDVNWCASKIPVISATTSYMDITS